MPSIKDLPSNVKQYILVTANYWAFTLTDGALRMLVVLHFHQLGYSPFAIAMLFIFYEFFGVVTNLLGGWLGSLTGLNRTMNIGLAIQVFALLMLVAPDEYLTVVWVMIAQALSGIAKDLNKMSAKSAIKFLVSSDQAGTKLFRWVALLTGSKNTMKGVGFFLGAILLQVFGFQNAALFMAVVLSFILLISLIKLEPGMGKANTKPKFSQLLSKSRPINFLSSARFFLFGARDIWFVVALPVYLSSQLGWTFWQVGIFMALWVIGYGIIQANAPKVTGQLNPEKNIKLWSTILTLVTLVIVILFGFTSLSPTLVLIIGLIIFGAAFAINSSLHSFLIVHYSSHDSVSIDVGFYYMANAAGRLVGTILSGWVYQQAGLLSCLVVSGVFIAVASGLSFFLNSKD